MTDLLKAGLVTCDFDGGCGAEGMADHGDFGQMGAIFPGGPVDTFEALGTRAYGAFFPAKDSRCPAQIVAIAVYASSNSARRISICALRSSLSIRWPGDISFGSSLEKMKSTTSNECLSEPRLCLILPAASRSGRLPRPLGVWY